MNPETRWQLAVLEADDWICQKCGTPKHLDAAHILPKSRRPDLRLDPTNGITLCRQCHADFHAHPYEFELFIYSWREHGTRRTDFVMTEPRPAAMPHTHRSRRTRSQSQFTDAWAQQQNARL